MPLTTLLHWAYAANITRGGGLVVELTTDVQVQPKDLFERYSIKSNSYRQDSRSLVDTE